MEDKPKAVNPNIQREAWHTETYSYLKVDLIK